jgi:hypothetical protein
MVTRRQFQAMQSAGKKGPRLRLGSGVDRLWTFCISQQRSFSDFSVPMHSPRRPLSIALLKKIRERLFRITNVQSEFKNLIPRSISHRRTIRALKGYRSTLLTASGIPWCKSDRPLCKTERVAQLGSVCAAQASFSRDLLISFIPVNYISMFRR